MKLKRTLPAAAAILFCSVIAHAQEEEITLSTYYPAPYGEYDEIKTNKLTVGPYTFPEEDGEPGQILVTDGLGNLSWQDPPVGMAELPSVKYEIWCKEGSSGSFVGPKGGQDGGWTALSDDHSGSFPEPKGGAQMRVWLEPADALPATIRYGINFREDSPGVSIGPTFAQDGVWTPVCDNHATFHHRGGARMMVELVPNAGVDPADLPNIKYSIHCKEGEHHEYPGAKTAQNGTWTGISDDDDLDEAGIKIKVWLEERP